VGKRRSNVRFIQNLELEVVLADGTKIKRDFDYGTIWNTQSIQRQADDPDYIDVIFSDGSRVLGLHIGAVEINT